MVTFGFVKNHEAVVEGGGVNEVEVGILFVELFDFVDGEGGGGESEDFDLDTFGFVDEDVESVDVDVAVDEDDFLFGLFYHFNEERVSIENLAVKEDFLVFGVLAVFAAVVLVDEIKEFGEFFVIFALGF